MQIVYHLGVHFTDEGRLLQCLRANQDLLTSEGVAVPDPKLYRTAVRDLVVSLGGRPASAEQQSTLLDTVVANPETERLVLSWDSFLALPPWALKGTLYPAAAERVQAFANVFPDDEVEFFMALKNPATLLAQLYHRNNPGSYDAFFGTMDPYSLRWSEVIARILDKNPHVQLTVWCDEDTPLVWPEVLRAVAGLPADQPLQGEFDMLALLLPRRGLGGLLSHLEAQQPSSIAHRREIITAYLAQFAVPDHLATTFEMPNWDQTIVDELTEIYEEDVAKIIESGAVTFIHP